MLLEFRVDYFKNFMQGLSFKLGDNSKDDSAKYDYNQNVITDGIVNTAIIYGINGSGKTNLGLALFDIVSHLTDKMKEVNLYVPYKNLLAPEEEDPYFYYKFKFMEHTLEYEYGKKDANLLTFEKLHIDGRLCIFCDMDNKDGIHVALSGADRLNTNLFDFNMSFVKYVYSNTSLDITDSRSQVFIAFMQFVNEMLFFRSLGENKYIGFYSVVESVASSIIRSGKIKEFENFLKENASLAYELKAGKKDGQDCIFCKFKDKWIDFYAIASSGTVSLALLFYWWIKFENVSLAFIDEYDAFYHFRLARRLVEMMAKNKKTQTIFTTHNTDVISNDVLRPDCFYMIKDGKIDSFSNLTSKDLRQYNDLQKMFRAGAFDGE